MTIDFWREGVQRRDPILEIRVLEQRGMLKVCHIHVFHKAGLITQSRVSFLRLFSSERLIWQGESEDSRCFEGELQRSAFVSAVQREGGKIVREQRNMEPGAWASSPYCCYY